MMSWLLWGVVGAGLGWLVARLPDVIVRLARTSNPTPRHAAVLHWSVRLSPVLMALYAGLAQTAWPLAVATLLLTITLVDLKYHLIPDALTLPMIGALLVAAYWRDPSSAFWVGGGFALVVFTGPFLLRPGGLGGGDVKLAVVIGLLLGFPTLIWALLIGASSGAAVLIGLNWGRDRDHRVMVPYGPFLCLGTLLMLPL